METPYFRLPYQDDLLHQHLRALFGGINTQAITLLRQHLEWVEIRSGEVLMRQGDPGEAMYLLVSGRLRAYGENGGENGGAGPRRMLREIARGEIVGEMSLYTDEPRSATVVAVRDSVLVRLAKEDFKRLLAGSSEISIALTRQIIRRLQNEESGMASKRPVTIGIFPVSGGVDQKRFGLRLARQLEKQGRVRVVDAAAIEQELHSFDHARDRKMAPLTQVSMLLDRLEARHDFVLLVSDDGPSEWTDCCIRHADELLLLADASATPALHPIESISLAQRQSCAEAAEVLVLLHALDARAPRHTRLWLERRPVADHIHIRPESERDMARLARIESRSAIGLVLAGGGARGFAHIGIYRALKERGIEIDYVGGTSIGSVMGFLFASDRPYAEIERIAHQVPGMHPTGDYNWLPLLSLIKGQRLRTIMAHLVEELQGFDADIEDLWINFYCVATNFSRASEQMIRHGSIVQALAASSAIPGALPPVVRNGELCCDGGAFNNFPVDVMLRQRGVGKIIGIDLMQDKPRRVRHAHIPGSLAILCDRLRPRHRRQYHLPSLMDYLMRVAVLYSMSRQEQHKKLTDLYFNPPLRRVGMLEWERFAEIVEQGYAHGQQVLAALDPAELRAFGVEDGATPVSDTTQPAHESLPDRLQVG